MDLEELQKIQEENDKKFYSHNKSELQDIRHCLLHLGKLIGKLSTFCEKSEHQIISKKDEIKEEVIPDLLFWSLHLANTCNLNLEETYLKRLEKNKERIESLNNP